MKRHRGITHKEKDLKQRFNDFNACNASTKSGQVQRMSDLEQCFEPLHFPHFF